jgi:glycolate oxidase
MSEIAFPSPDPAILARADAIRTALKALLPAECVVIDEAGRRAFETDALTAYRRMPLAVVLPRTTEEAAAALCRRRTRSSSASPR